MDIEPRKDRVSRIARTLMFSLGYKSIQEFADAIGVTYMKLYYSVTGNVNTLSEEVITKILEKHPNVSRRFLMDGEGDIFVDENHSTSYGELIPSANGVTNADILVLLERVSILLEKVHAREQALDERIDRVIALENRLLDLLPKADVKSIKK